MKSENRETPKEFFIETLMLSLHFMLFSVVTIGLGAGGALAAMYKGLFRTLKEQPRSKTRSEQFKEDFLSTMPESLFALIVLGALGFSAYTLLTLTDASFMIRLGGGFLAFETVLISAYIFPALAVFKFPSMLHAFRTALLMSHFHVLLTLKLAGAFIIAFLGAFELTLFLLPFSIVLYAYLSSKALHPVFMHYVKRIEDEQGTMNTPPPPPSSVETEDEDPFEDQ
ncbi:MAG: hypothetical protein ACOC14_02100 [Bacillota bacterium]